MATMAMRKTASRYCGCSQRTDLWLYNASAVGLRMYTLLLVTLRQPTRRQPEGNHCKGIRTSPGLTLDSV